MDTPSVPTPPEPQFTPYQRLPLRTGALAAIQALGDVWNDEVIRNTGTAISELTRFLNSVRSAPADLIENEVEFSRNFHTYLRKYTDDPLSSLLYRLRADNVGVGVWHAFVKGAYAAITKKGRTDIYSATHTMAVYYQDHDELPDNTYMHYTLLAWVEAGYVKDMIKTLKEWMKEDES